MKLKFFGVDVVSFGDYFVDCDGLKYLLLKYVRKVNGVNGFLGDFLSLIVKLLIYKDFFQNIYKKYIFI